MTLKQEEKANPHRGGAHKNGFQSPLCDRHTVIFHIHIEYLNNYVSIYFSKAAIAALAQLVTWGKGESHLAQDTSLLLGHLERPASICSHALIGRVNFIYLILWSHKKTEPRSQTHNLLAFMLMDTGTVRHHVTTAQTWIHVGLRHLRVEQNSTHQDNKTVKEP